MLCWEDDNLGCWKEIAPLKEVLEYDYRYHVEMKRLPLPSQNPEGFIASVLQNYRNSYDGPDNL